MQAINHINNSDTTFYSDNSFDLDNPNNFENFNPNSLYGNFNDKHLDDDDFYFNNDEIHDDNNIVDNDNDDLGQLDFRPRSSTPNDPDLNETFYSSDEELEDDISNYFDNPLNISVNLYQISFNQSKDLSSAEDQQTFFSDE